MTLFKSPMTEPVHGSTQIIYNTAIVIDLLVKAGEIIVENIQCAWKQTMKMFCMRLSFSGFRITMHRILFNNGYLLVIMTEYLCCHKAGKTSAQYNSMIFVD